MATIKSHTDLEQSKKLVEILPLESADMIYVCTIDFKGDKHYDIDFRNNQPLFEDDVCAWSLAALLDVIGHYTLQTASDSKRVIIVSENGKPISSYSYPQPVDACYEMILKLHELNLL